MIIMRRSYSMPALLPAIFILLLCAVIGSVIAIIRARRPDRPFVSETRDYMDKPTLDESYASDYIGKTIFLDVTYLDHNERRIEQKQWHGVIETFSNTEGIRIRLANSDQTCCLPPDPRGLSKAKRGIYEIHSTGEEIGDPDYVAVWSRTAPDPNNPS